MENNKLAQRVKELRKLNGLSQEELAKNSGLSLRTIQRVENDETIPTGETLKRISTVLEVTPNELIDWDNNKETLKKTVKTKFEYLHIFNNKLVFSKTTEIIDSVEDYGKSVNNVFKTLMVFFIFIPIFTILAVIFYNLGKTGLAIYAGAFAFSFLMVAFYTMLFTSGSSLIKRENISKIMIRKNLFNNVVVIIHKESGRFKERYMVLEENQVDSMKESLLSEKLIEEKNIKLKGNKVYILAYMTVLAIIVLIYMLFFNEANQMVFFYGVIVGFPSVILLIKMIFKLINPLYNKTTNR